MINLVFVLKSLVDNKAIIHYIMLWYNKFRSRDSIHHESRAHDSIPSSDSDIKVMSLFSLSQHGRQFWVLAPALQKGGPTLPILWDVHAGGGKKSPNDAPWVKDSGGQFLHHSCWHSSGYERRTCWLNILVWPCSWWPSSLLIMGIIRLITRSRDLITSIMNLCSKS